MVIRKSASQQRTTAASLSPRKGFAYLFRNKKFQHFVLVFLGIFVLFQVLAVVTPLHGLQNFMASVIGNIYSIPVRGDTLLLQPVPFVITPLCTGITSISIWLGLLFGFRLPPLKEKWALAIWGSAIILLINFIRVQLIVYAGTLYYVDQVEMAHTISWFVLSAIIVVGWGYFMRRRYGWKNSNEMVKALLAS
jgi:exosortase/archaeosortase family protein